MSQPVSGGQWKAISAKGTALVSDTNCHVKRALIGGTYVGTVILHDASTTAGTSATSQVILIGLPGLNYPCAMEIGAEFHKGLVYEATGTPTLTIVYD